MATTVTGAQIEYSNGTTQISGTPTVIGWDYAENSSRATGVPSSTPHLRWTAHSYSRKTTDSAIRVSGILPGYNKYSYPYWGLAVVCDRPGDGNRIWKHAGTGYIPCQQNDAMEVTWWADVYFSAAELGSSTGSLTIYYGWRSSTGGTQAPFEVWNPNSNEDGRAFQQGSTSFLEEIIYG